MDERYFDFFSPRAITASVHLKTLLQKEVF